VAAGSGSSSLQAFFSRLVCGEAVPVPSELRRLARGVLGTSANPADVDDLVSAFVLKAIEATRAGGAGSAEHLLVMSEARLRSVVRHRLKQMRAEQCPRWRVVKGLREAVRSALALPLLEVEDLPLALVDGGRIRLERVREAVSWMLSGPEPVARQPVVISDRLLALYFPDDTNDDVLERVLPMADTVDVVAALDAPVLVKRLREDLGPALDRVLVQRLQGVPLKGIAADAGVSISTAHERVQDAVAVVRARACRSGLDNVALEPVLEMLGA
jgi:DNA-directed RNA polymerase specialized sigma24 family protein